MRLSELENKQGKGCESGCGSKTSLDVLTSIQGKVSPTGKRHATTAATPHPSASSTKTEGAIAESKSHPGTTQMGIETSTGGSLTGTCPSQAAVAVSSSHRGSGGASALPSGQYGDTTVVAAEIRFSPALNPLDWEMLTETEQCFARMRGLAMAETLRVRLKLQTYAVSKEVIMCVHFELMELGISSSPSYKCFFFCPHKEPEVSMTSTNEHLVISEVCVVLTVPFEIHHARNMF